MLSNEENEIVTRVGPGTPMGNTLRRYWIPALLSQRNRRTGLRPRPRPLARRGPRRVPRQRRPHRPAGRTVPAPPRRRCFRTQRGMRPALRLSRLEVRRLRRLHRHDERAGRKRLQAQGPPHGVSHRRTGRHHLGLSRPGRAHAAAAEIRLDAGAGIASPRHQGDPGVQLAAGAGRRHRHLARADHAPAADREHPRAAGSSRPTRSCAARRRSWSSIITDYGYQYAGIRPLGDSEMHIRTYQFILPFHQIRPSKSETGLPLDAGHIWVPMDDENTAGVQLGLLPGRWRADRGRPAGTRPRQRPAACRSGDVPFEGQPVEQLLLDRAGAEGRKLHRHRRHQRAGPRDPGEHGARSSIAPRSIWVRPTRRSSRRASCCARR